MRGQISGSCGWCHTLNPTTVRFCQRCGHEAHVARMRCRCPGCTTHPGELTQTVQCRRYGAFVAWPRHGVHRPIATPIAGHPVVDDCDDKRFGAMSRVQGRIGWSSSSPHGWWWIPRCASANRCSKGRASRWRW